MMENLPKGGNEQTLTDFSRSFESQTALLEWLYAQSQAGRWGVSRERFAAALECSAKKALTPGGATPQKLHDYLGALHLQDLALTTACAEGLEAAWEHFVATYRVYLRTAAAAILRCQVASAEACDLADSLFSELYGLAGGKRAERSLFRYFHGRSSLKTWLRAVLAQRHIDSIRAGRRFEELAEDDSGDGSPRTLPGPLAQPADPHRERYVAFFTRALQTALDGLAPQEKERLRLYYAEEKTLAEIGRLLGEHESSVSRHLDRVRRDLRQVAEEILRNGIGAANGFAAQPGMSDAEIALCFEYSSADIPIDLDKLLPRSDSPAPPAGKRTP
ncbi:MAG TPA: RNA polymerase sigma factor [Candidatus Acidoferrum sp.]|nr:RNA polymerase sigma factor [Candidatus Acidoferrum sp.]